MLISLQHRLRVLSLYRTILRLHKSLPQSLKVLGDTWVKDEFKRNKVLSSPSEINVFLKEWEDYATVLRFQTVKTDTVGKQLSEDELNSFRDEQIHALHNIMKEASNKPGEPNS